jgi:N-ethylmaleimide reductase
MPTHLLDPVRFGPIELQNRIVMAPLTRGRATAAGVPTPIMATYYRQRASAGLIVAEATAISAQGVGWVCAPRIYDDAHSAGLASVTDAVHQAGGRIFLQLWHMGRVSHPDFLGGALPVGPSAIAASGQSRTASGHKPYVTPRALEASELPGIAADYAAAAGRAVAAGFDGVEIHGANGYLLDQFIRDAANQRQDRYGGSIENRWRFPLMVARAVAAEVGAQRTGIRLSPTANASGLCDSDPVASYRWGAAQLGALGILYIHLIDPRPTEASEDDAAPLLHAHLRQVFDGRLILAGGFDAEGGNAALAEDEADAIAFGRAFIANPDLPRRMRLGAALNVPDSSTFFSGGEVGYTDYPALSH